MFETAVVIGVMAGIYLFLTAPALFSQKERTPFLEKRYFAHRGLFCEKRKIPENSLAAFREAVCAGYGIEMDIQLSKDRKPVVFHDASLERMCGVKGKVWDYTFEELQRFRLKDSEEKIPSFEEVLHTVKGQVPLIIEYKLDRPSVEVCRICDEILQSYEGLYCIESFHPLALLWYRKNRPQIIRGQLSDDYREMKGNFIEKIAFFLVTYLLTNVISRPDFIAYNYKHEKNISRRLCGKLGAMSAAYTIKEQQQYEQVKDTFEIFIFDSCILK